MSTFKTMPEERPNERLARFVVAKVLDCPVTRFEDGQAPSQVEALIHRPNGVAALEIVGDLHQDFVEQWAALSRHRHQVEVSGLQRRWIVSITRKANVTNAVAALPRLMPQLEQGKILAQRGAARGVLRAWRHAGVPDRE